MNNNQLTFELFFIPHIKKWTVIVKDKGLRLQVPYLTQCGDSLKETTEKILNWVQQMEYQKPLNEQINAYVAQNKSGE